MIIFDSCEVNSNVNFHKLTTILLYLVSKKVNFSNDKPDMRTVFCLHVCVAMLQIAKRSSASVESPLVWTPGVRGGRGEKSRAAGQTRGQRRYVRDRIY